MWSVHIVNRSVAEIPYFKLFRRVFAAYYTTFLRSRFSRGGPETSTPTLESLGYRKNRTRGQGLGNRQ